MRKTTVTPYVYDNIVKWLEWNNTKIAKVDLVFAKTASGDFTRAQYLIDSLATDPANAPYIPYLQTNKDVAASGQTWDSLLTNPATKTLLLQIANDSLHPHMGHARAALGHAIKNNANYEFIEGVSNNASNRLSNHSSNESYLSDNSLQGVNLIAYPNPFKDELNINYSILDFEATAELQLIELATGRLIDHIELTQAFGIKQFNTENMANGLYVLSLKQNNKPSVNFKVINIK